jgi:predicted dehydrogenase
LPHAISCLRAGKHVLVEKPLGRTSAECLPLVEVIKQTGFQLQVGNMKRFDPGVAFAREFIAGDVGERLSVSGRYCDTELRPRMQDTLRAAPFRSNLQQSFEASFKSNRLTYKLFTHGNHLVNMLRYLGGEITAVEAMLATKYGNSSWHSVIEFSDGAVGHLELTTAVSMDWMEDYQVHGQYGSVTVALFLPFALRGSEVRVFDARSGEYRMPAVPANDPYQGQLEAFARSIVTGQPVTPDVYDGIADLQVLEAIQESLKVGGRVEVESNFTHLQR